MLLIALFHNVQGAMTTYSTRRQLSKLTQAQLNDMAIAPNDAVKEAKKANLLGFLHDVVHRQFKHKGH